jgi:hypothetical protein
VIDIITEIAGEIRDSVEPGSAPDHPESLRLFRLYALLALVKGEATTREDVHNAWIVWMVEVDDDHDALVPYDDLSEEQRDQDQPFVKAILAVVSRRGLSE